jgi:hypothetical protein
MGVIPLPKDIGSADRLNGPVHGAALTFPTDRTEKSNKKCNPLARTFETAATSAITL